MKAGKLEHRGEFVWVTYKAKTMRAMCTLCSPNGVSAIIMFDGMLGAYVGMMPILFTDDRYIDLIEHEPLVMTPYPSEAGTND